MTQPLDDLPGWKREGFFLLDTHCVPLPNPYMICYICLLSIYLLFIFYLLMRQCVKAQNSTHLSLVCSPVAGCLARAGRAVWAQSTSWKWAMPAHNNTHQIWRRAATGTNTRKSTSGERSHNLDLWLWSTAGTLGPNLPRTAAGPSFLDTLEPRVWKVNTF